MSSRSRRARTAFLQRKLFLIIFLETNGTQRQMGFKSAKGGGKGSKAARRNVGGDKSDAHKRKAEEAFMSPLEVMRLYRLCELKWSATGSSSGWVSRRVLIRSPDATCSA